MSPFSHERAAAHPRCWKDGIEAHREISVSLFRRGIRWLAQLRHFAEIAKRGYFRDNFDEMAERLQLLDDVAPPPNDGMELILPAAHSRH